MVEDEFKNCRDADEAIRHFVLSTVLDRRAEQFKEKGIVEFRTEERDVWLSQTESLEKMSRSLGRASCESRMINAHELLEREGTSLDVSLANRDRKANEREVANMLQHRSKVFLPIHHSRAFIDGVDDNQCAASGCFPGGGERTKKLVARATQPVLLKNLSPRLDGLKAVAQ